MIDPYTKLTINKPASIARLRKIKDSLPSTSRGKRSSLGPDKQAERRSYEQ
jgi:hypothetical protein